jgi:hypothetical protein
LEGTAGTLVQTAQGVNVAAGQGCAAMIQVKYFWLNIAIAELTPG